MALPPFQAFLEQHRADVYRYLVAAVGPADADDCFQETFLSALRAYPSVADPGKLRAWVLAIARNRAIDHARVRARRAAVGLSEQHPAVVEAAPDEELWHRVRALPPKQCGAVLLRFGSDMAYAEVARVLRCSEAAARRSVHEGIKKLREEVME
ncbi:MAG: RNA polymerase sigma factor [Candidatus Dormibacteria bacterium]